MCFVYFLIGAAFALSGFGVLMIFGRFYNKRVKRRLEAEDAAKDPYWKQFKHAYGDASDLPALFERMRAGDSEVWGELSQRLCYGGQAFSNGSLAAVPVLVDYAGAVATSLREPPLNLVAAIAGDAPRILMHPQLQAPYTDAIRRARIFAADALASATTEQEVVSFVTMIAVADGLNAIGSRGACMFFDSELEVACPHCDGEFIIETESEPWEVQTFDREPVSPADPPQDTLTTPYAAMAREHGQEKFAAWLEKLRSVAKCPHCGETATVLEGLSS